MGLVGLKYKTYHAWGDSKEQIRFVEYNQEDWESEEVFFKELVEEIHDGFSFSDKYGGCDAEIIPLEKISLEKLKEELKYKLESIKYYQKHCLELQEAIVKVKNV